MENKNIQPAKALQFFLNRDFDSDPAEARRRIDKGIRFLINHLNIQAIDTDEKHYAFIDIFEILYGMKEVFIESTQEV